MAALGLTQRTTGGTGSSSSANAGTCVWATHAWPSLGAHRSSGIVVQAAWCTSAGAQGLADSPVGPRIIVRFEDR